MDVKQRNHEIKMMFRQLGELDVLDEDDFMRGCLLWIQRQSYRFTTTREVHAFLTGTLEAVRWLQKEEEEDDEGDNS